jgi:hypothetical protein
MAKYLESSVRWHAVPLFFVSDDKDTARLKFPPEDTYVHTIVPECLYRQSGNVNFIDLYASLAELQVRTIDDMGFGTGAEKLVTGGYLSPTTRMEDTELAELIDISSGQEIETLVDIE